jgi:voltage-gated potassium channel
MVGHALNWGMLGERLSRFIDPQSRATGARVFRAAHHLMLAAGVGVMLVNTVRAWRLDWAGALDVGFWIVCAFFFAEYVLRLIAAAIGPGAEHFGKWRARLGWAISISGLPDLLGIIPGVLALVFGPEFASLFGFLWTFKLVRYAPGLAGLRRVIRDSRNALLSVLIGFCIVLVISASLAYLLERAAQPQTFGSMPAALWWAITTLTTTGYGDITPVTPLGRVLGGVVMVSGIMVFALWAGILATGFAEETRRRQFLQTWDLVAKVPFFQNVGAAAIADVARLLRPREYAAGAIIVRRGEPGDCMYFVVSGQVEVQLKPESVLLGPGEFFGEVALLSGGLRNATIVATRLCTLLSLDIADFRQLLARQPDLARVIGDEAQRRPGGAARRTGRRTRQRAAPLS